MKGIILSHNSIALVSALSGRWQIANQSIYKGLELSNHQDPDEYINFHNLMALVYEKQNNKSKRLEWLLNAAASPSFKFAKAENRARIYYNIGEAFEIMALPDSATYYTDLAGKINKDINIYGLQNGIERVRGRIAIGQNDYLEGISHFHKSIDLSRRVNNQYYISENFLDISKAYFTMKQKDSAILYGQKALQIAVQLHNYEVIAGASKILSQSEQDHPQKTIQYLNLIIAANDSLFNIDKLNQAQNVIDLEEEKKYESNAQQAKYQYEKKQNTFIGLFSTLLAISILLFYNNRQKQKANRLLGLQRDEIQIQKDLLQSTQAQLIQSEKMASLGELTAGIAHEIQNPLNFVNNFSEINNDLVNEANEEIKTLNNQYPMLNAQGLQEILTDIKINSEKINQHGLRASNIVKSMLEHSRPSSGKKEPTDLNKLCDEFIRLSFHGLKAKDKSFECNYSMDLEPNLPLADVVSQDIGRVILNLVNNAFQACAERNLSATRERSKLKEAGGKEIEDIPSSFSSIPYSPNVTVITKHKDDKIEIIVSDNGSGIPDSIKEKIFQPFFTTKPTGQGTGLGLSLAYDIIKAHNGDLRCESKLGNTLFIISIPAG